jgi:hypothetical protein
MFRETPRLYRNTSWRWLESDGTDGLAARTVVSPFDYEICNVRGAMGPGVALDPTARFYQPPAATRAAIELLLEDRLEAVIGGLPHNGQIISSDDSGSEGDFDAEDDLGNADREAVMATHGFAQAVASTGPNAIVGTNAVATCVAVLGRVRRVNGDWLVGCTHLSEADMNTFALAYASLEGLLRVMDRVATIGAGLVQLYAVGGRVGHADIYQEFSRLIGAAEQLVFDLGAINGYRLELAGAELPANEPGYALAVHVSGAGVKYTSDFSDLSGAKPAPGAYLVDVSL